MKACWLHTLLIVLCCTLGACTDPADRKPVSLTMWHVYGSQTSSPMNKLVEKFNNTVGKKQNIRINVTSISNSTAIHFSLVATARDIPGEGIMPDMFVAYPKTALAIGPDRLADWKTLLGKEELEGFVPSFLEEGTINGQLLVLPIAKSTSALFINATIFDKFARETGAGYDDLKTWEGVFKTAARYYDWSGGKAFFKYDDWLHYSMLNTVSLGGAFFAENSINFDDQAFRKVWMSLAKEALAGHVCLLDGYSTTALMTGEAVCGVESTASILYFNDKVTFADNTTLPLRIAVLPVPHFDGAKPLAVQRGAGLIIQKSTPEKERACAVFARWLTDTENNLPFAAEAGYLPVKKDAYGKRMQDCVPEAKRQEYVMLYDTIAKIYAESTFYIPPYSEGYGELERRFCNAETEIFKKYRGRRAKDLSPDIFCPAMYEELRQGMN